jgi:hypothetical protein
MPRCPFCHNNPDVRDDDGTWIACCQAAHDDYVARCTNGDDHDVDDATLTLIIDSFYGADEP